MYFNLIRNGKEEEVLLELSKLKGSGIKNCKADTSSTQNEDIDTVEDTDDSKIDVLIPMSNLDITADSPKQSKNQPDEDGWITISKSKKRWLNNTNWFNGHAMLYFKIYLTMLKIFIISFAIYSDAVTLVIWILFSKAMLNIAWWFLKFSIWSSPLNSAMILYTCDELKAKMRNASSLARSVY